MGCSAAFFFTFFYTPASHKMLKILPPKPTFREPNLLPSCSHPT
jgi:hypothetical protein